jgi:hypothetical protein
MRSACAALQREMLRSTGEKRQKLQADLAALVAQSRLLSPNGAASCRSRNSKRPAG